MEAAEAKCTAQHSKRVTASVRTVWMNPIEDLVMRLLFSWKCFRAGYPINFCIKAKCLAG